MAFLGSSVRPAKDKRQAPSPLMNVLDQGHSVEGLTHRHAIGILTQDTDGKVTTHN